LESRTISALRRDDYRPALAAGIAALAVYAFTLAPTVTGEDSGELIGAAYTLGVPHPPGYPVWTMLAHLFTWIPIGNGAWRVNFFSAACGAGTVALLVLIGITLTGKRLPAVLGALLFAFSRAFWEQALIAEVYTLNTLFLAAMLLIALRGVRNASVASLQALALLAGLGTGVHSTQVLLLPFWAIFAWRYLPPGLRRSPALFVKLAALFLLGASVYGYLPLASLRDPAVDWGNPETLRAWWDVVRREQYGFMVDQYPRSAGRFAGQLATLGFFWARDFLLLGAVLGVWGGWLLARRDRFVGLFLAAMAVVTVAGIAWMQNFEQNREWLWVMRVFLLPAELITALGAICALAWGASGNRRLQPFITGLATAALLASLVLHLPQSKRHYTYAEDYGRNILANLPEGAIYVPGPDHQAFPVLYLQAVEGLRPDVTLLRKYGYLDLDAVPGLREANPEWLPYPKLRYDPEIFGWILTHTDRPLFFSKETTISGAQAEFAATGLLVQALRPGETATPGVAIADLSWRNPLPEEPVAEYSLSLIQYDVALARARGAFAAGDRESALAQVEAAVAFGHREIEVLNNAGVLCGRNGALEAAAAYFREILAREPEHATARKNLERAEQRGLAPATK